MVAPSASIKLPNEKYFNIKKSSFNVTVSFAIIQQECKLKFLCMTIFLQTNLMKRKKRVKVDNISVSLKQQKILETNLLRQGGRYETRNNNFLDNKLTFIPPDFGHCR